MYPGLEYFRLQLRCKQDQQFDIEALKTLVHYSTGIGNANSREKITSVLHSKRFLLVQVALISAVVATIPIVYWLALLTRFHNPDARCSIEKWQNVWCGGRELHVGSPALPYTAKEWMDLRQRYQQSLQKCSDHPKSTLADG